MAENERIGASFNIDITDLKAGLAQANRLIKESESEFRAAAAGMDDWSDSEEGLRKKIKSLEEVTDLQRKKVDALTQEYESLISDGLDPASRQATELRTKINNERTALAKNEKELKNQRDALDELANQSDDAADAVEDVGEAAEDTSDGFTVMKGAMSDLVSRGITSLISGCKSAVTSLLELGQETQEYREDIGKLKTAFEAAGKSTELATSTYKDFYSILGEEDRSVEAVNHLAKLVDTEEDMAKWTDIAAGVWGTFGDSLPIEGLTEASNETAKVGKLTGVLADALNWAGVSEDDFQESLDKCNGEREREQLITDTLNGLYKDAADLYKKNNKKVIEARKATSDYTDTMADLGEAVEPIQTEITSFKNELAKELAPVLTNKTIPAVKDFIKKLKEKNVVEKFGKVVGFVVDNFDKLVVGVGGAITIFKAFKAAMAVTTAITAAKTAVAGLTAGVGLATKAQAGWNAVMSANPIGAVITAVALLAGGIALLVNSEEDAVEQQDALSESQREAVTASQEAAEAYRDTKKAADELAGAELANIKHTQTLWGELQTLTDKNGKVKEGYEGRAQFILNELNSALDTEYKMNDGVIQQYGDIKKSIDDIIEKKKAQILLDAYADTYAEAVKNVSDAELARAAASRELNEAQTAEVESNIALIDAQFKLDEARRQGATNEILSLTKAHGEAAKKHEADMKRLDEAKAAMDEQNTNVQHYHEDIANYQKASTLILEGETGKAIDILSSYGNGFKTVASTAKLSADEQKKVLEDQVIDTEVNAQLMKKAYEDGVEGVTEEMIKTAQEQADAAKEEFLKVGGNITKGIAQGAEGEEKTKWTLSGAMTRLINGAVKAAQNAMDAHSPSRRFKKEVGRLAGLGVAVGIDDSTKDVVKSIKNQVKSMKNAYDLSGISDGVDVGLNVRSASNKSNATAGAGGGVTVYQTNNYSQAHSRFELYKSKQQTAAAVRLALGAT